MPYARSIMAVESKRTINKTGLTTTETRYFVSSLRSDERTTATSWLELTRGQRAGVENRTHWRRDACLGEDLTRSRNPNLLINLALIRNAALVLFNDHYPERPLPEIKEIFMAKPGLALSLLWSTS